MVLYPEKKSLYLSESGAEALFASLNRSSSVREKLLRAARCYQDTVNVNRTSDQNLDN